MELFHFLRPLWLLLVPAGFVLAWLWRNPIDSCRRWGSIIAPHLLDHLTIGEKDRPRFRPIHLVVGALALGGVSTAGPAWEKEPPPFAEDKAPMVVALDLSRTMDAVDVPPTRLERAKQKVRDLAALRSGSRTGLVVYAGTAHLVLPPTEDPALLEIFLAALDTSLMPMAGKNAAEALAVADRLLAVESAPGTVLFITDGFDVKKLRTFSAHSEQTPHQVLALAAGTSQGGPIRDKNGRMATDGHGRLIQARFDRESFARFSAEAAVPSASLTLDETDVEWVQRRAMHHLQVVQERTAEVHWKEAGYYATFPIAVLSALWFRRGWTVRWMPVVILVLLIGLAAPTSARVLNDSNPKSDARHSKQENAQNPAQRVYTGVKSLVVNLFLTADQQGRWYFERGDYTTAAERLRDPMWKGLAYYRTGDYASALAQFARLDQAEAFFLMGNCYARMKDYPAAIGAYDNALGRRASFHEAMANRNLVAGLIPRKPKKDDEEGEHDPNLDPDEIKFDKKGKRGKAGAVPQWKVKPEQMAELWMRNLKTSPAEFLREKFRVQAEEATQVPKERS